MRHAIKASARAFTACCGVLATLAGCGASSSGVVPQVDSVSVELEEVVLQGLPEASIVLVDVNLVHTNEAGGRLILVGFKVVLDMPTRTLGVEVRLPLMPPFHIQVPLDETIDA